MKNSSINNPSESSWVDSDDEEKDMMTFDDASPTRAIRNGRLMRKSTYHLRKEEVLNNLNSSKRIKLLSSEQSNMNFGDEVENYMEYSENNISLSVSQDEHIEEKEAISSIKQMIGIGELQIDENDIKDIEINLLQKVISNHESVVNKVFIEDIDIYLKSEDELKASSNDIHKDILLTFLRNRDANETKKGCSSVARFLIENNLNQEGTKKNEINKYDKKSKLKVNKLNTFMSNKSEEIEFNSYSSSKK